MEAIEQEVVDVIVPMSVIGRSGDWIMAQYFLSIIGETYIYNTRTKELYLGYSEPEEAYFDWQELTGEKKDEEDE
jgi:hypothetical protein